MKENLTVITSQVLNNVNNIELLCSYRLAVFFLFFIFSSFLLLFFFSFFTSLQYCSSFFNTLHLAVLLLILYSIAHHFFTFLTLQDHQCSFIHFFTLSSS